MLRIKKIARDLDIKYAYSSPVETKNKWKKMKYIFRESLIIPVYIINPNYGSQFKNLEA